MLIAALCTGLASSLTPAPGAGPLHEPPAAPPAEIEVMDEGPHARPSLIADVLAYEPGKPFTLGVTFEIDDHWHLYWDGANDSGFAPTIELGLPEGWTIGDWQWPAPVRHETAPGQILDFIYEHRVTLFARVTPPAEARGAARIEAALEWLVCQEACVPGDARLSLNLPQGAAAASKHAPLFDDARARVPQSLTAEAIAQFSWGWSRGALRITPHEPGWLTFAPSGSMTPLADRFRSTLAKPGKTLVIAPATGAAEPRISGVLEVFDSEKQSVAIYYLDVAAGALPEPADSPGAEGRTKPNP